MGLTLSQPDNLTWEEWMCELMCGDPEPEDDEEMHLYPVDKENE